MFALQILSEAGVEFAVLGITGNFPKHMRHKYHRRTMIFDLHHAVDRPLNSLNGMAQVWQYGMPTLVKLK